MAAFTDRLAKENKEYKDKIKQIVNNIDTLDLTIKNIMSMQPSIEDINKSIANETSSK